jgi:hypothetical protein
MTVAGSNEPIRTSTGYLQLQARSQEGPELSRSPVGERESAESAVRTMVVGDGRRHRRRLRSRPSKTNPKQLELLLQLLDLLESK